MAYWQTHSPHKAKHECFCFYGACANPHTPEIANYRPDCLSHHKRHAAMAETKKATATKTQSCYAVTRQAGIAEGTALKLGSYHRKITVTATKTIVQALLQEQ